MNKITIKIGNVSREITCPGSWDDLLLRDMALFYETMFTNVGDENSQAAFTSVKLITIAQKVLGVDMAFMAKWEADCIKNSPELGGLEFLSELAKVIEVCLDGLFQRHENADGSVAWSVKFNRTKNPYPILAYSPKWAKKGSKKEVHNYAPKDGLSNITIYEMAYTWQQYENYLASGDMQHVHDLIGTLYRPSRALNKAERDSDWFGDRRQPLRRHEGKIEDRAKLAATLPTLAKRLIVFWFASCRDSIIRDYPRVFKKSSKKGADGGNSWAKLLMSLAETGILGNLDQTADQHYSNAMELLTMRDEQAKEAERKALERNMK